MDEHIREFRSHHGRDPAIVVRSPESIIMLGDYAAENDGLTLSLAKDDYLKILAAPRGDKILNIHVIDLDEKLLINLDQLAQEETGDFTHLPGWALCPAGIV